MIAIHAAIAYDDAITIAYRGFKSTEGEHEKAPDALIAALKNPSPEHVHLLRTVVKKKDAVSYQGEYQTIRDAASILRRAEQFCAWAEEMYQNRPPAQSSLSVSVSVSLCLCVSPSVSGRPLRTPLTVSILFPCYAPA